MRLLTLLAVVLLAFPAAAGPSVTVYGNNQGGNGYAWVEEIRALNLKSPRNTLMLENLPREVEENSVQLMPQKEGAFRVMSEQFHFDLVNQQAMLQRFLGQKVAVERVVGDAIRREEGTLLNEAPLMIEKTDGSVLSFQQYDAIHFPKLPQGLALEPSLEATLESTGSGTENARLLYRSGGFGWWMDYVLRLAPGGESGLLDATLHVTNNSGRDYTDAALSVVGGTVQQAASPRPQYAKAMMMRAPMAAEMAMDAGVSQASVGDVHRYDVPGTATLPNSSTTELPFFGKPVSIPVSKRYRYRGTAMGYGGGYYLDRNQGLDSRQEVEVFMTLANTKASGLGLSLPEGNLKTFAEGGGKVSFIGETTMQRLAPEEKTELALGTAFDITGKRVQQEYEMDQARKTIRETIVVTLNNRSKKDVTVDVEEPLYRSQEATIIEHSKDFEKIDATTIRFPVKVSAGGEETVRYTVKYTWQ